MPRIVAGAFLNAKGSSVSFSIQAAAWASRLALSRCEVEPFFCLPFRAVGAGSSEVQPFFCLPFREAVVVALWSEGVL